MEATIHVTNKKAVEFVGAACLATEGGAFSGVAANKPNKTEFNKTQTKYK